MTIFMSYSRVDEDAVKTLARAFEEARRELWFDHDLEGGDVWWETILRNIRACTVFVFALSDNVQANPLADLQYVPFRRDDAITGFAVLAAADRKAAQQVPLPDPLPPEPPIPLAYLAVIRRQIDMSEPDLATQLQIVDQLRRALGEETEPEVRREIKSILHALLAKPWRAQQAGFEIRAVLGALAEMEDEIEKLTGGGATVPLRQPGPEQGEQIEQEPVEPGPVEPGPHFDPWGAFIGRFDSGDDAAGNAPSPEEMFAQRMEEISRQMQAGAAVREAAGGRPQLEPGASAATKPKPVRPPEPPEFRGVSTTRPQPGSAPSPEFSLPC